MDSNDTTARLYNERYDKKGNRRYRKNEKSICTFQSKVSKPPWRLINLDKTTFMTVRTNVSKPPWRLINLFAKRGNNCCKKFQSLHEGLSPQIMHIGPYSEEGPTIEKLYNFIEEKSYEFDGSLPDERHHEIYISDMRRTKPEKLKTIIRQPMKRRS